MPRSKLILFVVASAIATVIAVIVTKCGDDRDRTDPDRPAATSSSKGSSTSPSSPSSPTPSARSPSSSASSPTSPNVVAPIPAEAMPELVDALAAGRTADVVELCASPTARGAHPADCTIAACREHLEARARTWFPTVAEADQPRVTQACEQAKITVAKPVRIHPHPHHRGEVD